MTHDRFVEIHARIAAEERKRTVELERKLQERMAAEKVQIQAQATAAANAAVAPRLIEAEKAKRGAERQLRELQANHDGIVARRVQEARKALEKAKADAIAAEKSQAFKDKLKLEATVQSLQRQIENKTAAELGEGGEVDLFEALKTNFPDDRITRVNKGTAGADIIHKIVDNERVCGQIVYDSKNRNSWRNDYVSKLRQDQLAAEAEHAVLSTQVFPAGARQVHVQDGVIIANPARVIALVEVLRTHIIQIAGARLSREARNDKVNRLYEFITSDRCRQVLDRIESFAGDMLDIDVKEKKAHDLTWRRRGELALGIQRSHGILVSEIEQIIHVSDAEQSA